MAGRDVVTASAAHQTELSHWHRTVVPRTRVAIVDDHAMVRAGVRALLACEHDLEVVGEASDGASALPLLQKTDADVIVMDLSMPGRSGLEALYEIRADHPSVQVLIFTGHPAAAYSEVLGRQGVAGLLNKACEPEEIPRAVRAVAAGRRYFHCVGAGADRDVSPGSAALATLSRRQLQLLSRFAHGESVSGISQSLGLSAKTVTMHRHELLRKLCLRTNAQLMLYALRHCLLD